MDILLDTTTFIMIIAEPERLPKKAKDVFSNTDNRIFVSVVSGWEIMVKNKLGKLPLTRPAEEILTEDVVKHSIDIIPLEIRDILQLTDLFQIHRDPFDRMLICQAQARRMTILSPDPVFKKYPVKTMW